MDAQASTAPLPEQVDLRPNPRTGAGEALHARVNEAAPPEESHECFVCSRRYDRLDHLRRHELSHSDQRNYACEKCPMRFNRGDLLGRHLATHEFDNGSNPRRMKRAAYACQSCIAAKTKCSNDRPCQRCLAKTLHCLEGPAQKRRRPATTRIADSEATWTDESHFARLGSPAEAETTSSESRSGLLYPSQPAAAATAAAAAAAESTNLRQPSGSLSLTGPNLRDGMPAINSPSGVLYPGFPNFPSDSVGICFGVDENLVTDDSTDGPDMFPILQDVSFGLDTYPHSMYSESLLAVMSDEPMLRLPQKSNSQDGSPLANTTAQPNCNQARAMRHEAFKQSIWLWTPTHHDHADVEGSQLSVSEDEIVQPADDRRWKGSRCLEPPRMRDAASRDEMLSMAVRFSASNLDVRSFPSFNSLNFLIKVFFLRQDDCSDTWIHAGTFEADKCRSELLAAIVAAGSSLFGAPNVRNMGLALHEIVRMAITQSLSDDNCLVRNLQIHQAYLMWVEVGLWSGIRRKMEMGEGFANNLPTMLRRAGAFRQGFYSSSVEPTQDDEGDVLKRKWRDWVKQQSFKRLVLRLFINEMQSSIAFNRGPVWSGLEIGFHLPAARDLWDARSAHEWKSRFLSKPNRSVSVTLFDAVHDPSRLRAEKDVIDVNLAVLAILHVFWGRVWSYIESRKFSIGAASGASQRSTSLWVAAHRQELLEQLHKVILNLKSLRAFSSEASLVSQTLLLSIYTFPDEMQTFAGRYGAEEAILALPCLREWAATEDRYHAIWHAGQVVRAARQFPRAHLTGFYAIAVYHACLCLWIFNVLARSAATTGCSSAARMRQNEDPNQNEGNGSSAAVDNPFPHRQDVTESFQSEDEAPRVILDGEDTADVQMFLRTGYGFPCLHLGGVTKEIQDPSTISMLIMDVFQSNFPTGNRSLPPLLENLRKLIRDLGKTSCV